MQWLGFLPWWILVPYLVLWLYVMITLIMEDREPADTLAWAFALLLVPVLGIIFYFIAGRDWATISEKKKWMQDYLAQMQTTLKPYFARNAGADRRFRQIHGGTYVERLSDTMSREDGLGVVTADRAEIFPTGAEKFGRLKADLAAAQHFIHIQYFIWENDSSPTRSPRSSRSASRPACRCASSTTTWAASTGTSRKLEALVPLGAKVAKDVVSLSHMNYRDHRKIVVIDGDIGYTGGYNVGQEYVDGGERFAIWRDTHVRVTGQVVGELEALFAARWYDQTKEDVFIDEYLPAPPQRRGRGRHPLPGHRAVRGGPVAVLAPRPHGGRRQRRQAGVDPVALLRPGGRALRHHDQRVAERRGRALHDDRRPRQEGAVLGGVDVLPPLLKAGVKVYLYEAGFLHSKTLTADGQITAIGTMNMDIRSLRLHKELMLWMYDDGLAQRQEQLFEEDIANSHEVTLAEVDALSRKTRFRNSFMRMLSYFI